MPPQPATTTLSSSSTSSAPSPADAAIARLHYDIASFTSAADAVAAILTPIREAVAGRIKRVVAATWPFAVTVCHGSIVLGTSLPSSDVDIVVVGITPQTVSRISGGSSHSTPSSSPRMFAASAPNLTPQQQQQQLQLQLQRNAQRIAIETLAARLESCRVAGTVGGDSPREGGGGGGGGTDTPTQWVVSVKKLTNAVVPLLKVTCMIAGVPIKCDVAFAIAESGIPTNTVTSRLSEATSPSLSSLVVASMHSLPLASKGGILAVPLMQHFLSSIPALKPLVLVTKQLLLECSLNNPFSGGLSSYCVQILCLAFLLSPYMTQAESRVNALTAMLDLLPADRKGTDTGTRNSPSSSSPAVEEPTNKSGRKLPAPKQNVGKLFLAFLDFYGNQFDFRTVGVALQSPTCFFKLKDGKPTEDTSEAKSSDSSPSSTTTTLGAAVAAAAGGVGNTSLASTTSSAPGKPALLVIVDPLDHSRVVSHSVFNFPAVQSLFRHALSALVHHAPLHRAPVGGSSGLPTGHSEAAHGNISDMLSLILRDATKFHDLTR